MKLFQERKRSFKDTFLASRGVLLALATGLTISCASGLVKHLTNIHPMELAMCRCWMSAGLALPHLVLRGEDVLGPATYRASLIITAFMTANTLIFHFLTTRYLPLGVAAVLVSTPPAFVTVSARIFLKEKFGLLQVVSVLATITGVIFTSGLYKSISNTTYTVENLYGLSAALVTVASAVGSATMLRKLRSIHYSVVLFTSGIFGIIESTMLTGIMGSFTMPYRGVQQAFVILLVLTAYVGIVCSILSFHYGEAGPIITMRCSSEIFFSFVLQVVTSGNIPDWLTIFGAVLVCVASILVGFSRSFQRCLPHKWQTQC